MLFALTSLALGFTALSRPLVPQQRTIAPAMQYDSKTLDPTMGGLAPQGINGDERPEGVHGTGFRFMPTVSNEKDSSPAVLLIAGFYPGLTAEQLMGPAPVPFSPPGAWNYHMLAGDSAPGGFVAIPGSQLLDDNPNTVAVVCMSTAIGLEVPDEQEHETLALINRSDPAVVDPAAMDPKRFYAYADPQGAIHIRWFETIPEGWTILGRLLYTQMPHVVRPGAGQGFAETSDDFTF